VQGGRIVVSAQCIRQHKRIEPVVLVAGRPIAAAPVFQLVGADHHHGDAASNRASTTGPAGRSMATSLAPNATQHRQQLPQPRRAVLNAASMHQRAAVWSTIAIA
jgi:hypothetical protein